MDSPIRDYEYHEQDADGELQPMRRRVITHGRERPFAAEYALLAELGLGE
jgi:hypothetical protein